MIVWTLQHLGIPVSYSVGSTLSFGPSGKFDPTSQFFVYECDEFDRNFLNFQPWLSLITSVDYDHPDTYPTEDEYLAAFRTFGHQSDSVIAWQETAACSDDHNVQVLTEYNPDIHLAGEHNRRNGMLALEAVKHMTEIDEASIITSINQFPGAGRRFEKLAEGLYSDYGHHPVEIKATLQLAQELSSHVVLVYQPHQNVRQHEIIAQYTADIFEAAEEIYWLPTYLTRENSGLPILSPQELTRHIVASRPDCVTFAELDDALWDHITAALDAGKLVLCMGAGTIDHWVRQRAATLDA